MVATIEDRAVFDVTGADALAYLQGQVSQDVEAIGPDQSAWSLVLDPTGKLVAVFRLHRRDDRWMIDADPTVAEALIARLERFKLRSDVTFTPLDGWRMLSVRNDDVEPASAAGDVIVDVAWPGFAGHDVLGPAVEAPAGHVVDRDGFERARIEAGVPRVGVDLDDDTIPAEGGAALIDAAVSFTKGCYTGQELVARINSRGGNVPRPLRRLRGEAPLARGATVTFDGQDVGTVTSAADEFALARVMRKAEPGSPVQVGAAAAVVEELTDT